MSQIYGDDFGWFAAVTLHQTFEEEDAVLAAHHLRAATVEWRFEANREIGPTEVLPANGELCRKPFGEVHQRPFREFIAAHSTYLAALKALLEDRTAGLPGS